jgi:lipoprotein-anchoring transpeptidase ErfK/SrfK
MAMLLIRLGLLLLLASVFTGCSMVEAYIPTTADFAPRHGRTTVRIDLSAQRAYLYRAGNQIAATRISTGRDGYDTPVGRFRVTQKSRHHRSSIYGDYVRGGHVVKANVDVRKHSRPPGSRFLGAPMPYFMRFQGAVGMHAGNVPWYPASHGCVRLPPRMARAFFHHVSIGTPVRVQP